MPKRPIRVIIAVLVLAVSLAGCYTNPGPAGLTPIPTLAAEPTLVAAAGATSATPAGQPTAGATAAATASATGAATAAPTGTAPVAAAASPTAAAASPTAAPPAAAAPTATAAQPAGGAAQGNPQEGQQLFAANCAACHGADAGGTPGLAPALKNNKFIQAGPDSAIFQTIANGRPGTAMPAWSQAKGGKLTDAQINSLIAYLKTLQ